MCRLHGLIHIWNNSIFVRSTNQISLLNVWLNSNEFMLLDSPDNPVLTVKYAESSL